VSKKRTKRGAERGDVATNRQASHRYNLFDRFECGIALMGSEVKSLRQGRAQLKDSYARITQGEVWLFNMHISPYGPASRDNHDPDRARKLLLHRFEIERLIGKTQQRGLTLVPTRIYFSGSHAKVEVALARGKDVRDRRRDLKEKEQRREIDRELARAERGRR
jgi:SsrA-binding protein